MSAKRVMNSKVIKAMMPESSITVRLTPKDLGGVLASLGSSDFEALMVGLELDLIFMPEARRVELTRCLKALAKKVASG